MQKETGKLFIVSTPIGNLEDITFRAVDTLKNVDLILAEDTRHSAKLISQFQISKKLIAFHDHNEKRQYIKIIEKLKGGSNIALISDAGTPLINDPGFNLVRSAKQENINVVPIPGACSPIAALSASGLPANFFTFCGFVPSKDNERIRFFEKMTKSHATSIFFESPHRILKTMNVLIKIIENDRKVCLAKELTKTYEKIVTGNAQEIASFLNESPQNTKGEFVILLEGAKNEKVEFSNDEEKIYRMLYQEVGISKGAKIISSIFNIEKKICYQRLLDLKND